jgi:hypothetical protein
MLHQHIQHHHHHNHHSLSVPSSPISTTSSDGGVGGNVTTQNDIQYHHHPQHHYHHHVISTSPQDYQEEDIHLQDYQTSSASLMNHHSHSHSDICGINVNPFTGSLGGSNEIPQLVRMEKRKRTNYSMGGNKAKIEEAVKYLLELSERARPNVRNVAEKVTDPTLSCPLHSLILCSRWEFLTTLSEITSRKLKVSWLHQEELSLIILWRSIKEQKLLKNFLSNLLKLKHLPQPPMM